MRVLLLLGLVGCVTETSVGVSLVLPADAPAGLTIRLSVGRSEAACPVIPPDAQVRMFFENDEARPRVGRLREGRTIFHAAAWNGDCTTCFAGCSAIDVGEDDAVEVTLTTAPCSEALCANLDGGVDAGDAGDAGDPRDAGDAGDAGDTDLPDVLDAGSDAMDAGDVTVPDSGGLRATAIASGGRHTCAIREDGDLFCWGDNRELQAAGPASATLSPSLVAFSEAAEQVSLGDTHSCARFGGRVYCWGENTADFRLGFDGVSRTATPMRVQGLPTPLAVDLSVGWWHSCAAFADDSIYCWGQNQSGELGLCCDEGPMARVVTGEVGSRVAAGSGPSCRYGVDDRLICWGFNRPQNPLGTPEIDVASPPGPVQLAGEDWTGAERVESGGDNQDGFGGHLCALREGRLFCWGRNQQGQIGAGTMSPVSEPFQVPGLPMIRDFALGGRHTCAITMDNALYCWGLNDDGQLGDGTGTRRLTPGTPLSLEAVRVSAGQAHTCAIDLDGAVHCWGRGDRGQLGNGAMAGSLVPVPTDPLE
ncbi:MAG: hypothetical protein AAGE52_33010 [Myxococcota bacterium]